MGFGSELGSSHGVVSIARVKKMVTRYEVATYGYSKITFYAIEFAGFALALLLFPHLPAWLGKISYLSGVLSNGFASKIITFFVAYILGRYLLPLVGYFLFVKSKEG